MPKVLSADQIDHFGKDGYVAPIRAISPERAGSIRQRLEELERNTGHTLRGFLRDRPHLLFPWLNELIREERIVDAVEDLYGGNLMCWGSSFFVKEPGEPTFVSWHQDATYWGLSSSDVVTVWLALSESTRENGAMEVVPGTHLTQQPHRETYAKDNLLTRGQEVAVVIEPGSTVALELQPGEMSLHHVGIVHGSAPNRSKSKRRIGFVIRYIPTHVRQLNGDDSATLVRGSDTYRSFHHEPVPRREFDPAGLEARRQAGEWWNKNQAAVDAAAKRAKVAS